MNDNPKAPRALVAPRSELRLIKQTPGTTNNFPKALQGFPNFYWFLFVAAGADGVERTGIDLMKPFRAKFSDKSLFVQI
jgi:hypothetical protein